MDSPLFTNIHVAISLVGIATGLVVMQGLLAARRYPVVTAIFLLFTVLTSVTGYFFHRAHVLPSHIVGAISLVVLALALAALYAFHLRGAWRAVYVITAVLAEYLNVFVLVVQSFLKIPALHALAPTGTTEPVFVGTQGAALVVFLVIGFLGLRRFRPVP
jgi:hypothetical protein